VLSQIGVGRSLSSVDNIGRLDHQRSDFTVRWHPVGDRRAGDEPDTDFSTPATETSGLVHRGHQTLAHETSNEITNPVVCTS
jgi:hypothetical protein